MSEHDDHDDDGQQQQQQQQGSDHSGLLSGRGGGRRLEDDLDDMDPPNEMLQEGTEEDDDENLDLMVDTGVQLPDGQLSSRLGAEPRDMTFDHDHQEIPVVKVMVHSYHPHVIPEEETDDGDDDDDDDDDDDEEEDAVGAPIAAAPEAALPKPPPLPPPPHVVAAGDARDMSMDTTTTVAVLDTTTLSDDVETTQKKKTRERDHDDDDDKTALQLLRLRKRIHMLLVILTVLLLAVLVALVVLILKQEEEVVDHEIENKGRVISPPLSILYPNMPPFLEPPQWWMDSTSQPVSLEIVMEGPRADTTMTGDEETTTTTTTRGPLYYQEMAWVIVDTLENVAVYSSATAGWYRTQDPATRRPQGRERWLVQQDGSGSEDGGGSRTSIQLFPGEYEIRVQQQQQQVLLGPGDAVTTLTTACCLGGGGRYQVMQRKRIQQPEDGNGSAAENESHVVLVLVNGTFSSLEADSGNDYVSSTFTVEPQQQQEQDDTLVLETSSVPTLSPTPVKPTLPPLSPPPTTITVAPTTLGFGTIEGSSSNDENDNDDDDPVSFQRACQRAQGPVRIPSHVDVEFDDLDDAPNGMDENDDLTACDGTAMNGTGFWFYIDGFSSTLLVDTCDRHTEVDTHIAVYSMPVAKNDDNDECMLSCVSLEEQSPSIDSDCDGKSWVEWQASADLRYYVLVHATDSYSAYQDVRIKFRSYAATLN